MKYFSLRWAIVSALVIVICTSTSGLRLNRGRTSALIPTQPQRAKPQLDKLFRKYELLKLDQQRITEEVRQSGRFSLVTSQGTWELVLSPHDMRAPNYHATCVGAGGVARALDVGPVNTFKGTVVGSNGSQVRFTIDQKRFEGLIIKDGEHYYFESARNFSAAADATEFVFYRASDVIQDSNGTCGVTMNDKVIGVERQVLPTSRARISSSNTIELATEADYEYVSTLGGPANAANDILSIMNQVEGVYETQLGLTFEIVFQNTWDTPADPYSTTADSIQILNEFTSYWNANFFNVPRDLAHLFTGKNMGGVIGRAWQSVFCVSPTFSYGLSRYYDHPILKYNTPAHEIGHNIGATHGDAHPECIGSIMNPTTTSGLTFCQYSRNEIANYLSFYDQCLTATTTYRISGQVTDINGKPASGVPVALNAQPLVVVETDAGGNYSFSSLTPGLTYVVTASKASYSFTPQHQTFTYLNSDQTAHFTVTASPDGPIMATEATSSRTIALDSILLLRDPFPVVRSNNFFSPDHHTRVVLFAVNASLLPGENLSVVSVEAEDTFGRVFLLPVESAAKVPNLDWLTQITIRLPDEINSAGDLLVSVKLRGAVSNKGLISIAP